MCQAFCHLPCHAKASAICKHIDFLQPFGKQSPNFIFEPLNENGNQRSVQETDGPKELTRRYLVGLVYWQLFVYSLSPMLNIQTNVL